MGVELAEQDGWMGGCGVVVFGFELVVGEEESGGGFERGGLWGGGGDRGVDVVA